MMKGRRPYVGKSRKEIRDSIFAKQVQIKKFDVPEGWSYEAADFINKLLQRKPANRLGLNGPDEVKSHIWLKDTDWAAVVAKTLPAPFVPSADGDNFDAVQANAADKWNDENQELLKQNSLLLRKNSVQDLFSGYYYDHERVAQPERPKRPETVKIEVPKKRRTFSLKW